MTGDPLILSRRALLGRLMLASGGLLSAPLVSAILSGASAADAPPPGLLDKDMMALIAAVAETFIPATDTPGAIGAGVPDYIHLLLARWYKPGERERLLAVFRDIDRAARTAHGKPFAALAPAVREAVLSAIDAALFRDTDPELFKEAETRPPFLEVKLMVITGYYTSEAGASVELRYDPVPGPIDPCIPLESVGRAWSLYG